MWPFANRVWASREASVIGSGVRIQGRIESDGELTIYGQVEGDITHEGLLIIEAGATCLSDNIRAVDMRIAGVVRGNVQVENTLELQSTAKLYGDTECNALRIAPGATFVGSNRMAGAPDLPAPVAEPAAPHWPPVELPAARPSPVESPAPQRTFAEPPVKQPLAEGALAILLEPCTGNEKEVLAHKAAEPHRAPHLQVVPPIPPAPHLQLVPPAASAAHEDQPAFYGGFSPAFRSTGS